MFFKKVDLKLREDGKYELWIKKNDHSFEVVILDVAELEALIGMYRQIK